MISFATLIQGTLLAGGMFVYSGFSIAAFQRFHYHAVVSWMAALVLLGLVSGRWFWPERSRAWKITGIGFLLFTLIHLVLGLVFGEANGTIPPLETAGTFIYVYVPWFWLPFAIGVLVGGFRRKTSEPNKPENVAGI